MEQDIFKAYSIDALIEITSKSLETLRADARLNAVAEAEAVLKEYACKNPDGKPLFPPSKGSVYNDLVEILIPSSGQADQLGVEGQKVSVSFLWKLAKAEVVSSGQNDPSSRWSLAVDLLASGTRDTSRYDATVDAYPAARDAYALLSTSAALKPEDHIAAEKGQSILDQLKANKDSTILLAEREYATFVSGAFGAFDTGVFERGQQQYRGNYNVCNHHSHAHPVEHPFITIYSPEKMADVEALMQHDKTSAWLLQQVKESSTPVLLHEYPKLVVSAVKGWRGGSYCANTGKEARESHFFSDYVRIFTFHELPLLMLAVAYAHEARHKWQKDSLSLEELNPKNLIDVIILNMLKESDAQAIGTKVLWSLKKKLEYKESDILGKKDVLKDFEHAFHQRAYTELSYSAKLKKATQSVFSEFLEREISNASSRLEHFQESSEISTYLERFMDKYLVQSGDAVEPGRLCAWTEQSPFLKPAFLRRLSRYGNSNSCYLDDDGIELVQKFFIEGLPAALSNHRQSLNGSTKRSDGGLESSLHLS